MDNVTRDADWVQREYGQEKWPRTARIIDSEVSDGGDFGDIVRRIARRELGAADGAFDEWLTWIWSTVASTADGADAVIELGAGWGRQLFGVYAAGGPPDALYVAAEYTSSGRAASERLAAAAPSIRFRAVPFDYYDAALELPHIERAVVFTVHSVEQIPQLPHDFVTFVAGVADDVTVLHFEPVGWQIVGGDESYAVRHDYNRNLAPLLRGHEAVRLIDEQVDVQAVTAENPTSLLKWTPRVDPR